MLLSGKTRRKSSRPEKVSNSLSARKTPNGYFSHVRPGRVSLLDNRLCDYKTKKQLELNYDGNIGSCQKIRICDVDSDRHSGDMNIDDGPGLCAKITREFNDDLDLCAEITWDIDDNCDEIIMDKEN